MRKKLLITGGSGLLAVNWAVVSRSDYAVELAVHDRIISLPGVGVQQISLKSVDNIVAALKVVQPTYVIHTAGLTNVELCEKDPKLAYYINADLANNVAKACSLCGVPLVHISTDHLFAGDSQMLTEEEPIDPVNIEKPNGRGVFLMRNLADEVNFEDNGRIVELNFHLS